MGKDHIAQFLSNIKDNISAYASYYPAEFYNSHTGPDCNHSERWLENVKPCAMNSLTAGDQTAFSSSVLGPQSSVVTGQHSPSDGYHGYQANTRVQMVHGYGTTLSDGQVDFMTQSYVVGEQAFDARSNTFRGDQVCGFHKDMGYMYERTNSAGRTSLPTLLRPAMQMEKHANIDTSTGVRNPLKW